MEIRFNKPACLGTEQSEIQQAIQEGRLSGDNRYSRQCQAWFNDKLSCTSLLTPSATHALEMAALLVDIRPGDEVIMPSYTFVSTANAFVLRGAKIIFVDIRPDTLNLDESFIEDAITEKTRAIVPVHYAGVVCEMDTILAIAKKHNIAVVEDAAQAICSTYKGKAAGSFGAMSAISFHETKNITAGGEGGLLAVNQPEFIERAEVIREKGTNRAQFFKGQVDKYTWVDVGSSYLLSEIQAAYLYAQLQGIDKIQSARMAIWEKYRAALEPLQEAGKIQLPVIPDHCEHNAHMFYIKLDDKAERDRVLQRMQQQKINAVFHYVPLHSAPYGMHNSRFHGADQYTTRESERLIRLPLWYGMKENETDYVVTQLLAALQ